MNLDKKNMVSSEFLYIFDSKVGGWARFFLPSNLIHFEIAKTSSEAPPWLSSPERTKKHYNICRISHPRALDHASILIPLAIMQEVIKSIEAMAVKVKHEHEHDVDGCSRLMLRIPRAYLPRHPL